MAEFHLAIVGGCMTHQRGIPFNTLYHRQLAREMREREGVTVRTHVARAVASDYLERLHVLRERRPVDGVLLHVRVMVVKRARMFVPREGSRLHYAPHPALFSRTHASRAVERLRASEASTGRMAVDGRGDVKPQLTGSRRGVRIAGFRLRDLNWTLGALLRLDRWAVDDEMLRLRPFVAACRADGLRVFVLGPTPMGNANWQARTLRLLNERLSDFCRNEHIPFARIDTTVDDAGQPLLMADGVHLTVHGHGYVSQRLLAAGIDRWMD